MKASEPYVGNGGDALQVPESEQRRQRVGEGHAGSGFAALTPRWSTGYIGLCWEE